METIFVNAKLIEERKKSNIISSDETKFIINLVESVKYGTVTINLSLGKIISIEKDEKIRIK
ncbi:DUF2292 domain-containing protein [Clostridium cylindrosporum]|uniref:DUF2292 domain-containing protein n=1 Tax=Clostridium cylindrosporum TaxID=1495 RepID=UPI00065C7F00|nr:DUF2292 domain-containing protein [Clostridium cylindrosporum]